MTDVATGGDEKIAFKDKVSVLQVGASVAIAIVGFAFTYVQFDAANRRSQAERQDKQFESFLTLSQQCASDDEQERGRVRRVLFEYNQNPKLERNAMLEELMTSCSKLITERDAGPLASSVKPTTTSTPSSRPTPPPTAAPAPPEARPTPGSTSPETWVYLGTYRNRIWETRYLDFPNTSTPSQLNAIYEVRRATGALNVRTGPFSPATGAFPPVTASLAPGRKVRVLSTWPWYNSDNWWARVEIL